MHAQDVAASVLDIAFAEDAPQALNIVNPQRPPWVKIMTSTRDAVREKKRVADRQRSDDGFIRGLGRAAGEESRQCDARGPR